MPWAPTNVPPVTAPSKGAKPEPHARHGKDQGLGLFPYDGQSLALSAQTVLPGQLAFVAHGAVKVLPGLPGIRRVIHAYAVARWCAYEVARRAANGLVSTRFSTSPVVETFL